MMHSIFLLKPNLPISNYAQRVHMSMPLTEVFKEINHETIKEHNENYLASIIEQEVQDYSKPTRFEYPENNKRTHGYDG